jgi:transposase
MKHRTMAVDLAKTVFEVGISERPGQMKQTLRLSRARLLRFMARQQEATVVMEACGSAHYWGREFQKLGHEVVLLPPAYVTPYVFRNKTDRNDAKGLLEAYRNREIRPVPIKTVSQHQVAALHRARQGWVRTRTARINAMRGILREIGLTIPVGAGKAVERVRALIEDAEVEICDGIRGVLDEMCLEVRELENRIDRIERQLEALCQQSAQTQSLRSIPGVGLLTATAVVGFVGDLARFRSGRHFAGYLGLTPRERSSGLRRRLGSISKQGDPYLRTLLIHGGRSVLRAAKSKKRRDRLHNWALEVEKRRGHNKAAVAVANKLARLLWAVSTRGTAYHCSKA